ncbi:MAG: glycerophosphodiester phosphodiesterase family protein, partial [Nocardioides sp.]
LTNQRVPTSAAPVEVAVFRFSPSGRLAAAVTGRSFDALQVPVSWGRLRVVTPGLIRRAHAAGKHVHVWTVDHPDEMRRLLDLGVDGLISDQTDTLRIVLTERRLWRDHR